MCAGFPKSGNTLLGESLLYAGNIIESPFDIYVIKKNKEKPIANPLFDSEIYTIKTHDHFSRFANLDEIYFGEVKKVIVINRNPFDTLLSAINFFRVEYFNYGNNLQPHHIRAITALMPRFDFNFKNDFLDVFSLEKLRDEGMLDDALDNFSKNGTVILNFYSMSGPWAEFASSYDYSNLEVLKILFSDLLNISASSCSATEKYCPAILKLSDFLDISASKLASGFRQQAEATLKRHNDKKFGEAKFFNKMTDGYWKDYLSGEQCRKFVDKHYASMIRNGFEEIVSEF